jgi:hypothetical protein
MRKLMVAVWMMIAGTCLAQQIDLKSLDQFAAKAKSKTEINMDESMVKSASEFLNQEKKDEAAVKKTVKDLKGLFLRSYEFDQSGAFRLEDLKPLLDQLKSPNWTSFLRNQEGGEQTEIWFHRTNGQTDGFLLIAAESKEITVINAIGLTGLQDLSSLGALGNFALESAARPAPKPAPKPEGQKDEDN